jgi:hypothetical protein
MPWNPSSWSVGDKTHCTATDVAHRARDGEREGKGGCPDSVGATTALPKARPAPLCAWALVVGVRETGRLLKASSVSRRRHCPRAIMNHDGNQESVNK